jgi:hypothetical protein
MIRVLIKKGRNPAPSLPNLNYSHLTINQSQLRQCHSGLSSWIQNYTEGYADEVSRRLTSLTNYEQVFVGQILLDDLFANFVGIV